MANDEQRAIRISVLRSMLLRERIAGERTTTNCRRDYRGRSEAVGIAIRDTSYRRRIEARALR